MLTELNQLETGLPQPQRAAWGQRELRLHIARIQNLRARLRGRKGTIRAILEVMIAGGGATK